LSTLCTTVDLLPMFLRQFVPPHFFGQLSFFFGLNLPPKLKNNFKRTSVHLGPSPPKHVMISWRFLFREEINRRTAGVTHHSSQYYSSDFTEFAPHPSCTPKVYGGVTLIVNHLEIWHSSAKSGMCPDTNNQISPRNWN